MSPTVKKVTAGPGIEQGDCLGKDLIQPYKRSMLRCDRETSVADTCHIYAEELMRISKNENSFHCYFLWAYQNKIVSALEKIVIIRGDIRFTYLVLEPTTERQVDNV